MIQRRKLKITSESDSMHHLVKEIRKAPKNYYQVMNRVNGYWARDWLTDWQIKNER